MIAMNFGPSKPSALVLIGVNLIPLAGVVFWGWDTFSVVFLYWLENLALGAITILKMITANPYPDEMDFSGKRGEAWRAVIHGLKEEHGDQTQTIQRTHHLSKLIFVPLFVVHYGFFCTLHGVFVFSLFGDKWMIGSPLEILSQTLDALHGPLLVSAVALTGSHLFSFFFNYIGHREYRSTTAITLMFHPYGRMVALHVAIVLGGILVAALDSPALLLLILMVGKTALDVKLHLREHRKITVEPREPAPDRTDDLLAP